MGRRSEIESRNSDFSKAVANQDAAALSAFYEEAARFLPAGAPMAEGRAAIQATMQALLDAGVQGLVLDTVDVIDDKDISVEVGRYTLTVQPPGADSVIDNGKYVITWRQQQDGTLKMAVDIFNSDSASA